MKYLIKRVTEYLHNYAVVPDDATHEFKEQLYRDLYGTKEYIEIDDSEMYNFGLLKLEAEAYKMSAEYRGELEPLQNLQETTFSQKGLII
jgi:hypothetical protein